jgi:hypothetical protein
MRLAHETNCLEIFRYLMKKIREGKVTATYFDRLLILNCTFISGDEKEDALDNVLEIVEAPSQFTKVAFND